MPFVVSLHIWICQEHLEVAVHFWTSLVLLKVKDVDVRVRITAILTLLSFSSPLELSIAHMAPSLNLLFCLEVSVHGMRAHFLLIPLSGSSAPCHLIELDFVSIPLISRHLFLKPLLSQQVALHLFYQIWGRPKFISSRLLWFSSWYLLVFIYRSSTFLVSTVWCIWNCLCSYFDKVVATFASTRGEYSSSWWKKTITQIILVEGYGFVSWRGVSKVIKL